MPRRTAGRKRKNDGLPDRDGKGNGNASRRKKQDISSPSAHLPAPIWGHVLDYLPYEEVRSALLVGKLFANEVVKYVQTLNIFNGSELYVPAARRFPNVTEANILCILKNMRAGEATDAMYDLNVKSMWKVVPFLSSLSKVERIFMGGWHPDLDIGKVTYYPDFAECTAPENHIALFSAFVDSFLGAMESGLMRSPPSLTYLEGLLNWSKPICQSDDGVIEDLDVNNVCHRCRLFYKYLPLNGDLPSGETCLSGMETYRILLKRQGGREFLANDSEKAFSWAIRAGRTTDETETYAFLRNFSVIDSLINEIGFRPGEMKKDSLMYLFKPMYIGAKIKWAKSSIDKLKERGFDVDGLEKFSKGIQIIDDSDPKNQSLREFMSEWNEIQLSEKLGT